MSESRSNPPLQLRHGVERVSADGSRPALLVLGDRILRLRGENSGWFLGLLDGRYNLSQLEALVGPNQAANLAALIAPLERLGFLERVGWLAGRTEEAEGEEKDLPRPQPAQHFEIFAAEALARHFAWALKCQGGDAKVSSVLPIHPGVESPATEPSKHGLEADETAQTRVLRIVLTQSYALGGLAEFDNVCRLQGLPWLLVDLTGDKLRIGPWIVPRSTACFSCWRHRMAAASPCPEDFDRIEGVRRARPAVDSRLEPTVFTSGLLTWIARIVITRADSALEIGAALKPSVEFGLFPAAARPAETRSVPRILPGSFLDLDLRDGGIQCHRVVVVPGCPGCGGLLLAGFKDRSATHKIPSFATADWTLLDSVDLSNEPTQLLAQPVPSAADRQCHTVSAPDPLLVDSLVGIVRRCRQLPLSKGDPQLTVWLAEGRQFDPDTPSGPGRELLGVGVAVDSDAALRAAIGEAVERYGAALYAPEMVRRATWLELEAAGERAIDPAVVAPFTAAQIAAFPAQLDGSWIPVAFDRSTRTGWVPGFDLAARVRTWVPAALVYLPYRYRPDEPFWTDCSSTGLAFGTDRDATTLRALLEVIERDAAALAWLRGTPWPTLPLDSLPGLSHLWHVCASCPDVQPHLADLTSDLGIPVVAAILEHNNGGVVLGTAARLDREAAAIGALLESHQARFAWKRDLIASLNPTAPQGFRDILTHQDHARLYTHPHHARRVLARLKPKARINSTIRVGKSSGTCFYTKDDKTALASLAAHLIAHGYTPVVLDITPPDLRSAGYWLIRAVVPGLVPLNARHTLLPLGLNRVHSAYPDFEVETTPHPFP